MRTKETKRKKRIAVIGLKGLPAFGGAATVGQSLIEHLKDDFDFTVYAISSHVSDRGIGLNGYRQVVFRKSRFRRLNIVKYVFLSMCHALVSKYDLVHIHHGSNGFITPILRLKYNVVLTLHGIYRTIDQDARYSGPAIVILTFFQKLNLTFANKIISVSSVDADHLNRKYGLNTISIPNGVSIPETPNHSKYNYIVFAAGRIYDLKGLHLILEAMHLSCKTQELLVIGNIDSSYSQKIKKLSTGLNIKFLPLIKEKSVLFEKIRGAQMFIFPSLMEAMSMMLLEVASLQVPLIVSDIPANLTVFNSDEVVFFRSNDPQSLAEKLVYAIDQPEELQVRTKKAFNKVKENYNWTVIASKYKEIYENLLS